MRRIFSALTSTVLIAALFFVMALPAFAQAITIEVDPESIELGGSLTISAAGLTPNERYTFEFVYVPSAQVVFTTDRVADGSGNITLSIRSDDTDAPGEYRVDVSLNRNLVGEAFFEIAEDTAPSAQPTAQGTPAPAIQPTLAPPLPNANIVVEVRPTSGRVRDDFLISIVGLTPRATTFVTVRESATNVIVYDREWAADANGQLSVNLFTTSQNAPGQYLVEVSDSSGVILATGGFELLGPGGRDARLTITRNTDREDVSFSITVTDAAQFSDITINIIDPDTRTSIQQRIVRTNVDGTATTEFTLPADMALKPFDVVLTDSEGEITRGVIPTGPTQSPDELAIAIRPESGAIGQVFSISANGLPLEGTATVRIRQGEEEVAVFTPRINRRGSASITFGSATLAQPGTYSAEFEVNGEVLIRQQFEVTAPVLPPVITIDPISGPRGTTHNVTVENLEPGVLATFQVLLDGRAVLTTSREVDSSGVVVLGLTSEPSDPAGEYTVDVSVDGASITSATFEIVGDEVEPQPPTDMPSDAITITPDAGPEGTSHLVEVSGLPSGTDLTVEVTYADEVVYTTDRVADENGNFSIRLVTEAGDADGVYTVAIVVDGAVFASADFSLVRAAVLPMPLVPDAVQQIASTGQVSTETIAGTLTSESLTFSTQIGGQAGELLVMAVTSQDFDTYLKVADSDGFEVAYNDDYNGLNSQVTLLVPYNQTYTVTVTSYDYNSDSTSTTGVGAFVLEIRRTIPASITVNNAVQADFSSANAYYLSVYMDATARYTVRAFGAQTDTSIEILSPYGDQMAFDDDSGHGLDPEILNFRPYESGTHTIIWSNVERSNGSMATLIVEEIAYGSLDEGTQSLVLTTKLQSDGVVFEGVAGSTESVVVDFLGGSATSISVEALQNGNTLMSYSSNFGVVPTLVLPIVVPDDGEVTVVLSAFNGSSSYDITLE